jgi:hypothetical protein
MKFLYPEFLFGLFTLAIPIIIHLFNFRKAKKVFFSSTRFLQNIKKSTSQKRQLKHFLILFSRLLFLTFLVLAFAQPYLPSEDKNPQAGSVYVYLDNSASMSNRTEGTTTSLNLGIDYLTNILDLYPTNTSYKLVTNEFAPFSNTLKSKTEIEELITEIRLSTISRSLSEAYSRLTTEVTNPMGRNKDVYVISDFQRSTIGDVGQVSIDSLDQVFITPIQFDQTKNVFIDTVFLSNPFLVADEKNQLNVVLKNYGLEDAEELPLKLYINEIQTASSVLNIPAGGEQDVSFEISFNLDNVNKCRISIEDYPVTFDNDFFFVLRLENRINVLEISEEDGTSPIQQVYANNTLFSYTRQNASNLDYSLIRQNDLVIVNGLNGLDNSLSLELNNHIEQGEGSLLIIPGEDPDISGYQNIIPSIRNAPADTSFITLSMPDLSDPFFENIFESSNERFEMPNARPVIQWGGQQLSLLKLRNNVNFLSGFRSQGTTFILATPLNDQHTNFHRHALFVPVMYRMASLSKKSFEAPYYNINLPTISLRLDSLNKQDIFKLTYDIQENELIPNQRISVNELVMELPKNTLQPGFYELKLEDQIKATLAFNLDKKESSLEQMDMQEINNAFSYKNNVTIFDVNDADNFSNEVKKNKFGVPLWKYAIILSLIFLLAEVLLIRFL